MQFSKTSIAFTFYLKIYIYILFCILVGEKEVSITEKPTACETLKRDLKDCRRCIAWEHNEEENEFQVISFL